jgi:hypothetical protein
LQPDRVQHPALRLGEPRRRVSLARERRDRLRHERVELSSHLRGRKRVEAA